MALEQAPEILRGSHAALVHDIRNLISGMVLYCDLLEEPGVLANRFRHYAAELRLIAGAGQRLLEVPALASFPAVGYQPIRSLAGEIQAMEALLSALAGPGVAVSFSLSCGNLPIALGASDLGRILINLTRNAVEAMQGKGRIQITLEQESDNLRLTFADSGPGIPESELEAVFSPGYSTHPRVEKKGNQRGLGLSIVRALTATAGGTVQAVNPPAQTPASGLSVSEQGGSAPLSGATFVLQFPIVPEFATQPTLRQPVGKETDPSLPHLPQIHPSHTLASASANPRAAP
jgi:signal transduction histidine kinase